MCLGAVEWEPQGTQTLRKLQVSLTPTNYLGPPALAAPFLLAIANDVGRGFLAGPPERGTRYRHPLGNAGAVSDAASWS